MRKTVWILLLLGAGALVGCAGLTLSGDYEVGGVKFHVDIPTTLPAEGVTR